MTQGMEKEVVGGKAEVVEQRLKPTLIRRRATKVEVAAPVEGETAPAIRAEEGEAAISPDQGVAQGIPAAEGAGPVVAEAPPPAPEVKGAAEATAKASVPGKPAEQEQRRIGVVGYINLGAIQGAAGAVKAKEDWRERQRRGGRRKSRAELELEAIQRAGGLRHYAEVFREDGSVVPAEEVPPAAGDAASVVPQSERIFQPGPLGKRRKGSRREFKKTSVTTPKAIKKVIRIDEGISVSHLSQSLGIKAIELIQRLVDLGIMATINQQIDAETASLLAQEYGSAVERTAFKEEDVLVEPDAKVSVENLVSRAPVVTVMGHVDHGKTSILDVIRQANVAGGEAGGITQHIGAYEVRHAKGTITFLDTPGHEAFTTMRARGAQVTDLVVLVVAADDGIMPQTVEAIDHAKAAGVPIVVAINKIDKQQAQLERVKQSLTEVGLVPEEWGGDTICVGTSAKTRAGIDQLLEMILLQAEVLELRVDPTLRPKGTVIEARLDRGRGPVATVLVQEGTLKVGAHVVAGTHEGRIRAMLDASGRPIEEAGPAKPVEIQGLSGVPAAGDSVVGVTDERGAKLVAEQRRARERLHSLAKPVHISLENLSSHLAAGEGEELAVILKTDVQGSIEAVAEALRKLSTEKVRLKVLHAGVGGIVESDVLLASASDAVVLGFNVVADTKAKEAAMREGVDVRSYRIIYEMLGEVRKAMEGLLAPEEKELWLGRAQVKEVFKISKVGAIAGCQVSQGKIARNARVRLIRDGSIVFEGKISSLRHFKDDAREVAEGLECGIGVENYSDLKQGDLIEAFIIEKKAATL